MDKKRVRKRKGMIDKLRKERTDEVGRVSIRMDNIMDLASTENMQRR